MLKRFMHEGSRIITKGGERYIEKELRYGAHNYHPLPVVLRRGEGVYLWDVSEKRYLDFLAAYSAVNQGHCHPKIVKAFVDQASTLTITSRAFYNDILGETEEMFHRVFNYDKALMMNTGCESVETAVKLIRKWGYEVKGIPEDQAKVIFCNGNFWGRSLAACGSSDDPDRYHHFGPFGFNFELIDYDNIPALEKALQDKNVAGIVLEPIQGEAGVIIPSKGYLKQVRDLCTKHNILMAADEVQTGLGRTGKLLAVDWEEVRPDIVCLGKSLSGGMMPVSVTLCDEQIMMTIRPGQHGSTFGGNPLAAKVAQVALETLFEEKMIENSEKLGAYFLQNLKNLEGGVIQHVRGRGLMNAMVINKEVSAWNVCMHLAQEGLLAKPTRNDTIRLTPPLIVNKEHVDEALEIITRVIRRL